MSIDTKKTRSQISNQREMGTGKYAYRQVVALVIIAQKLCDEVDRLNGEVEAERLAAKTANEALLAIKDVI